jgi:hypothetical protein
MDVPKEERLALYEDCWARPGFAKWLSVFHDVALDPEANAEYSDFIRDKIRAAVYDPAVAEKLLPPPDQPFGSRRIPLETFYFEAFNRSNVSLVDIRESPIERITPRGIKTGDTEHELDLIIFATGFDSFTGGFTRIDLRGEDGISIKDKWGSRGHTTYLCLMTAGFPNLFTLVPRQAGNYARSSDVAVRWVADTIQYLDDNGLTRIVPTQEAEDAWVSHELSFSKGSPVLAQKSWFNGGNIPGKPSFPPYGNTLPAYTEELAAVAENGYAGFRLGDRDGPVEDASEADVESLFVVGSVVPDGVDSLPV